jgi:hypothetical protein
MELYGATSPAPDWAIAQWDIPERLPPFRAGLSQNQFGSVHIMRDGSYELRQTTGELPCSKVFGSGRRLPDEFDLLVRHLQPTPRTAKASRESQTLPSLATTLAIHHDINVKFGEARILDKLCKNTMANILTATVLSNRAADQTFFYQVYLGRFVSRGRASRLVELRAAPSWFRTGQSAQSGGRGSFGYDDNIWAGYGLKPAVVGENTNIALDLLPRIRAIIVQGRRYGMDQDLSHWRISGTYHGQNAFGHVEASSRWSGFRLTITTSH